MSGGARRAAYVLPTIITVAVIAVAGTALIPQRLARSERFAAAEKVGAAYFSDVATFEAEVHSDLARVRSGDPVGALLALMQDSGAGQGDHRDGDDRRQDECRLAGSSAHGPNGSQCPGLRSFRP